MDYFSKEYEFLPWNSLTEKEKAEQDKWQRELTVRYPVTFGKDSVVSQDAFLYEIKKGTFGNRTQIGSYALLRRLEIVTGDNCSFNSYSVIHGRVTMGSNVRIAPGAKIFGENHGFSRLDKPICQQPNKSLGIVIGDDVWIGANAVICDGVHIGTGSVIGAGAVVTSDIPPYSVAGGVPARVLKSRLAAKKHDEDFLFAVSRFGEIMKDSFQRILSCHFEHGGYINAPSDKEQRRSICDAVEIAAMFSALPESMAKDDIIATIREFQKDENEYESVLSASYALEILGEKPIRFTFCEKIDAWEYLDSLKWQTDPWDAGHYTDIFATAAYFNKKYYSGKTPVDMFTWLNCHQNPDGMWGMGETRLKVNGYYRTTRGTYAQFKANPGYIRETVDTILAYAHKKGEPDNACDALDIIHPLYFASGFTSYRKSEGEAWCVKMLPVFMDRMTEAGFPFKVGEEASLKGTEMWLSIIYLMCDYLGISNLLGYEPKGVHSTK